MATLRDVATLAGVHPSTVSRALDPLQAGKVNAKTRARIDAAVQELGFQVDPVASGLRRGRTSTMGVMVADIGNPFIPPVLRGIENTFEARGYQTFIAETQDDQARAGRVLQNLVARRVEAIVTLASRQGDEAILERASRSIPVVLAVRGLPRTRLPCVTDDDELGGWLSADHLLSLGHQVVAELPGPGDVYNFEVRTRGFLSRIAESSSLFVRLDTQAHAPSVDEGRRLMRVLLERGAPRPTGVFAHNDLMALGAIQEVRAAGLSCPGEISIIGYNDAPLTAYTDPPLTTVAVDGYELGRRSAELALDMLDGNEATEVTLAPRVVPRASTAPPPA